jgi:hypothetical protein
MKIIYPDHQPVTKRVHDLKPLDCFIHEGHIYMVLNRDNAVLDISNMTCPCVSLMTGDVRAMSFLGESVVLVYPTLTL